MVWQEHVSCIVMLTKTFDFTKVMCVQYWAASKEKDECYGEQPEHQIYIGVVKEEELANFHIRTFRLYKMHNNVSIFFCFYLSFLFLYFIFFLYLHSRHFTSFISNSFFFFIFSFNGIIERNRKFLSLSHENCH